MAFPIEGTDRNKDEKYVNELLSEALKPTRPGDVFETDDKGMPEGGRWVNLELIS